MNFALISRKEAHERGLKRFYTGNPCIRGHDAQRFVTTGNCVRCNAERSKLFKSESQALQLARSRKMFAYPIDAEDYAALLAYAQGLDLARGKTPYVPPAQGSAPEEISPEQMRQMRAAALGKIVDFGPSAEGVAAGPNDSMQRFLNSEAPK